MLSNWLQHPETMGAEAVEKLPQMIAQYPYCATYRMLYCIALANTHSTQLKQELEKTACALPDRTQLFLLVNNGEYEWVKLFQQIEKQRRLEMQNEDEADGFDLVEQYLSQQHLPSMEFEGLMPKVASDYPLDQLDQIHVDPDDESEPLDASTTDESSDQDLLIDQFLSADNSGELMVPKPAVPIEEVPTPEPNIIREKAFLTESLAKLYVKQHKFEQALAIFSQLNLQYSQKSSNFADQIRYLEKVIAYQKEVLASSETKKL